MTTVVIFVLALIAFAIVDAPNRSRPQPSLKEQMVDQDNTPAVDQTASTATGTTESTTTIDKVSVAPSAASDDTHVAIPTEHVLRIKTLLEEADQYVVGAFHELAELIRKL